jgi:hypothetical protein
MELFLRSGKNAKKPPEADRRDTCVIVDEMSRKKGQVELEP